MAEAKSKNIHKIGEKVAFVICPIGDQESQERKRSDQILKHVLNPVVEKRGYKTIRADQISKPGQITNQIVDHVLNDALVIADLTSHNPNVFYEMAVRHMTRKPMIQIIQKGERIPFDVFSQRTIQIDYKDLDSVEDAKRELELQIVSVQKDPSNVDSPISTAISIQALKGSTDPEQTAIATIQNALIDLSNDIREIKTYLMKEEKRRRWQDNDKLDHLTRGYHFIPIGCDEIGKSGMSLNDWFNSKRSNNKINKQIKRAKEG